MAVGRSASKTLTLLQWTFRHFGCSEIVLVHVHQPSPMIPTPLGKLPASQANEKSLSAYRREERDATDKFLQSYMSTCYRAKVQASIIMTESENIHEGIIHMVASHGIQKLVIGATLDNCCLKAKGNSSKATYTAKGAPPFCEIWFVSKGKYVWTREASESTGSFLTAVNPHETVLRESIRSSSLNCQISEPILNPEYNGSSTLIGAKLKGDNTGVVASRANSCTTTTYGTNQNSSENSPLTSTTFSIASPAEINPQEELELGMSYNRLKEVTIEAERSKAEFFTENARRKKLEAEISKAYDKVKDFEVAHAQETKIREELERLFRTVKQQREELLHQRNDAMKALQNALRTNASLDVHSQEVASRGDKAAAKLELIESSIETLRLELQKVQWQREESVLRPEKWRSGHVIYPSCSKYFGFGRKPFSFLEFSLPDLQTATCEFSESFKLGQGGYGCLYKGEMLNRSVTIKKLHPYNIQSQLEYQKEIDVLGKLRHPHLVTLIGACPEALSLVYDFLPNGSLHDCLFRRTTNNPLTWKVRTRIAAQISIVLLFLHSCIPEKIIHGDLKPEKIFFDSNFNCKIVDFGTCQIVPEDTRHGHPFHWNMESKGAYTYADPEYQRTGVLTTKSDVYSFGIIVLQLLTGRPPLALADEVRRALSAGRLTSVLDITAGEWPIDVATRLAEFGLQCSKMNSRERLELMPEVVRELEKLHVLEERPVPPYFLCPILQEIMHDPQVAADGFTYEGNALRGWLQSGRDTSPMTNLKLEHLNLIPNHALRFAIHGWLCGS